jgi:hypothetical protein
VFLRILQKNKNRLNVDVKRFLMAGAVGFEPTARGFGVRKAVLQ